MICEYNMHFRANDNLCFGLVKVKAIAKDSFPTVAYRL